MYNTVPSSEGFLEAAGRMVQKDNEESEKHRSDLKVLKPKKCRRETSNI
jgi:hypothetical protein